jgi:hypothetical protein
MRGRGCGLLCRMSGMDRLLVKGFRHSLLDGDGPARALAKTVSQAVAKVIGNEAGLAVDDLDRPFGTTGHAQPAAVALFFVYLHDLSHSGRFHDFPFNLQLLSKFYDICRPFALTLVNSMFFL